MAENSKIEWTDATWNPIAGCRKVSPGCENCYAIREARRLAGNPNPKVSGVYEDLVTLNGTANWTGKVKLVEERLSQPLHWKKPRNIFVDSMSDLFHEDVRDVWLDRIWAVMELCPQHRFQVLTKRAARLPEFLGPGLCQLPNVHIGVSVESNDYRSRIDELRAAPAAVRWISAEPLIAPLDLSGHLDGIDWVVSGGESGPGARPSHPDWFRRIRDQCVEAKVAFFMKQITVRGKKVPFGQWPRDLQVREFPNAGRLLDGRTWDQMPAVKS